MYKIGDFSKITNITVKALRYYDEEGILIPSSRADNSYRYYDENDFKKARLITFLRALEFSIAEIKDVLAQYDSEEDLSYFLVEKKAWIEQKVIKEQELIEKIDRFLTYEKEEHRMEYVIEKKELNAVEVATMRFKGAYKDVGKYFGLIFKEAKNKAQGTPFCCYHDAGFSEDADIEVCVPVKGFVTSGDIVVKQLPRISAICTTHTGGYDTLNLAYKALLDYAQQHNVRCGLPSREIYHKGPGMLFRGNPNKYVTEIVIPIENS